MSPDPILSLPFHVQLHIVAGCLAVVIGPIALYGPKFGLRHKAPGYVWVVAMGVLAGTAFFISDFASDRHFGVLHGFAALTVWSLWFGLRAALRRDVATHRATFSSLYWNGLLVAGAFNFLPGRAVNRALFPEQPELGLYALALVLSALVIRLLRPLVHRLQVA